MNSPITGAVQTINNTIPKQLIYGNYPMKQPGKDSLIVITHGWELFPLPVDVSWVDVPVRKGHVL